MIRRKSSGIFVGTLLALAMATGIGSLNNKTTTSSDNLIVENETTESEDITYEVSIESVNSGMVADRFDLSEFEDMTTTEEETTMEEETTTEAPTEAPTEPETEAPVYVEPVTEAPVSTPVTWKYVFVGDSRTVGLEAALEKYGLRNSNQTFICEIGEGYDYLMNNMATIKSICDSSTVLIMAMGINDMNWRYNQYIAAMNDMATTMNCQIYFMLVTPVNEATEAAGGKFNIKNSDIDTFNARMVSGLDPRIHIIDGNSYLKNVIVDYTTMDGVHYTDETYYILYKYMMTFMPQ